jgi:hypothetical protein
MTSTNNENNSNGPTIGGSSNSGSLNLEELTMEYQTTLMKYNKAKMDYINYVKKISKNSTNAETSATSETKNKKKIKLMPGKKFMSSNNTPILDSSANSLEECKALCSSNSGCYGATFNSNDKTCIISGSDGDLTKGTDSDYAMITHSYTLLKRSQKLNDQLIKINDKISNIMMSNKKTIFSNNKMSSKKSQDLVVNRDQLSEERAIIDQALNEFKDLEENQEETDLMTHSNYYSFLLLLLLAIVFIIWVFYLIYSSSKTTTSTTSTSSTTTNIIKK